MLILLINHRRRYLQCLTKINKNRMVKFFVFQAIDFGRRHFYQVYCHANPSIVVWLPHEPRLHHLSIFLHVPFQLKYFPTNHCHQFTVNTHIFNKVAKNRVPKKFNKKIQ